MAVVIDFNVLEERRGGLLSGGQRLRVNELVFKRAPKSFHGGVVITIAFAAHAADSLSGTEQSAVSLSAVLEASVRVMQQAGLGLAPAQRLLQSLLGQAGAQVVSGVPADDPAAVEIPNRGQIK